MGWNSKEIFSIFLCLHRNITPWYLLGGRLSKVILFCYGRFFLSCRIVPITSSYIIPGHSIYGISACRRTPSGPSLHFCAWPVVFPYLLRAVLLRLQFEILACWFRLHLASVRPWRICVELQSCKVLFPRFPWDIWPVAVVLMLIGRSLHCHGFPTISACMVSTMFRRVLFLQIRRLSAYGDSFGFCIIHASPLLLYQGTLLCYQLFKWGCIGGCLSTTHLRSGARKCHHRSLKRVILTHLRLTLKVRAAGTFPTWLVVHTCLILPIFVFIMNCFKRCAWMLTSLPTSVFDLIPLAFRSVLALTDCTVVDTRVGTL